MKFELGIRPSGTLFYYSERDDNNAHSSVVSAFSENISAGLVLLATTKSGSQLSSTCRYWRKIAHHYLTHRCHQPGSESCELLLLPPISEFTEFLNSAPPMKGAEYLTVEAVINVWQQIDWWLCAEINTKYSGQLEKYLKSQAPHWHQVGRVCFHLAENKQDHEYPFAFMATYAAYVADDGRTRFKPLGKALSQYTGKKNKRELIQLLSPIDLAAKRSQRVLGWLESGDIYHPLRWTADETYQFIKEVSTYEECGIIVRLPDWWKKRVKAQVAITVSSKKQSSLGVDALLNFEVNTVLGDEKLTQKEWKTLMASADSLVLFKGQWVEVDHEKLIQALNHWQTVEKKVTQEGMSFSEGMRLLSGMPAQIGEADFIEETKQCSFVDAGQGLKTLLQQLRSPETIKARLPGNTLKAILRPYQVIGVNWLTQLSQLGLGACLADDMGLGKTIQIIALLLNLKKSSTHFKSLIVLPASLLNNWKDELNKFAPSLTCHFVHPAFLLPEYMNDPQLIEGKNVVLTTYGMLSRQPWLLNQSWQLLVLDEAQAIKNPNTKQAKSVKKVQALSKIALTGTPVENRLTDLWSLFDFLCPGLLGSASVFKKYVKTLEAVDTDQYAPLRALISPYILRRLKSDKNIIADLPDKTELYAYCGLTKMQTALYEKSVEQLKKRLAQDTPQKNNVIQRRGMVLSYLMRFKQICNHPAQYVGDGDYKPDTSGKFLRLGELAEEISARQEKVLVFTQFREMTQPIADFLANCFGQPGLILHGGTSVSKRKQYVDEFQREDGPPFFVLSIKAGGSGLNLTAASHVIHYDRWWNPAVENQATDRAYRIGQKRNVLVHKFVCKGTIEEKVDAMIREKQALAEELLAGDSGGDKMLTELSDDELINMVSLDVNQLLDTQGN